MTRREFGAAISAFGAGMLVILERHASSELREAGAL